MGEGAACRGIPSKQGAARGVGRLQRSIATIGAQSARAHAPMHPPTSCPQYGDSVNFTWTGNHGLWRIPGPDCPDVRGQRGCARIRRPPYTMAVPGELPCTPRPAMPTRLLSACRLGACLATRSPGTRMPRGFGSCRPQPLMATTPTRLMARETTGELIRVGPRPPSRRVPHAQGPCTPPLHRRVTHRCTPAPCAPQVCVPGAGPLRCRHACALQG